MNKFTRIFIALIFSIIHTVVVGYSLFPTGFLSGLNMAVLDFARDYSNFYFLMIYPIFSFVVLSFSKDMSKTVKTVSLFLIYLQVAIIPAFNQFVLAYYHETGWPKYVLIDLLVFPACLMLGTLLFIPYKIVFEKLAK